MNKKISGEDILIAIGDIDESLLSYPRRERYRDRLIKRLSLAAVIVICVSVIFSGYYNLVMKGANADYSPDSPEADYAGNANDSNASVGDESYAIPECLMISYDGKIMNLDAGESKIAKNADGAITVYLELPPEGTPLVYMLSDSLEISDELSYSIYNGYGMLMLSGNEVLLITSPTFDADIRLTVAECDNYYEISINYKAE